MGNTCETLCCGCFIPPLTTTNKLNESKKETIIEMPRSSSIFTIYSPMDYDAVECTFNESSQLHHHHDDSKSNSSSTIANEHEECSELEQMKTIEPTKVAFTVFSELVDKYLRQAYRMIIPNTAKCNYYSKSTSFQFFQSDTMSYENVIEEKEEENQPSVLSNLVSYIKKTSLINKLLVSKKCIESTTTTYKRRQLSPLSVFLLRVNDFNFL